MSPNPAPKSVIIIGAGIFGLSTALAISRRHPSTQVTVVDRLTPPVEDGSSVDTTRCIRADYADPIYARLAAEAQRRIEQDPDLSRHYFKQGMSFVVDGSPGTFLNNWKSSMESTRAEAGSQIVEMKDPESVYRRIHGHDAHLVPEATLGRKRRWNMGYNNMKAAFIDAKECVRIYYERCLAQPSITFQCGVAVEHLDIKNGRATGIVLENGRELTADLTLVATGAWSSKLIDLEGFVSPSGIEVAWIKVTDAEAAKWKNMSITTNFNTGFNLFPPHNGEIKCLRRSAGYRNTVTVPHPEDSSKKVQISHPRTSLSNPGDQIPAEAEAALRDNLRELMPELADRPFDRTKLCWLAQTPSADFIIAPHPRLQGVHVATGGSAHAWKFLPIIGDLVLDSIMGKMDKELVDKWAWARKNTDKGNAPRMAGEPQEIRQLVRSRL